ncbi:MAG TPA: glycosyltransferase family 1 protein [Puia sp.]|nr:glycosyltransferase family 1 protein [Puia sp.]
MNRVVYFFRKQNPAFFSIESSFGLVASAVETEYRDEYGVTVVRMPHHSSPRSILPNIRYARQRQGDINHITGDIHYALLGFDRKKVNVLTIHDCVLLQRLSRKNPRWWIIKWLWYDLPIGKADMVVAVSENTKRDLLRFTNCSPDKIRVIPQFIDPIFQPGPPLAFRDRPVILFVGTTVNKNLPRLAEAMEGISADLDIIGKLNSEQTECLKRYGISYRQCAGITFPELLEHYQDCDILAFPSTFEGFGAPILEGQAVGKPVLTSAMLPMNEVAGDGACLIDPYDPASIREGLLRIIGDHRYREGLIKAGLANAARFSLRNTAGSYARLYAELLERKKSASEKIFIPNVK